MAAREDETSKMEESMAVNEEDDEHGSKECVLLRYFLQEWKLVKSLLDDIISNGRVSDLSSVHKIRSIMDKYQEQGQLLEPYLESIVSPLMFIVRSKTLELGVATNDVLEVSDLELAVSLLEKCHDTNAVSSLRQESTGEMEAKCVILLWLSILVLVPFDISSVDTSIADSNYLGEDEPPPLVLRILGYVEGFHQLH
ncbi:hypothetical protein F0562_014755 [Nyssa sinensis]|uniref:Uncharacterized protein n=1 Tax=Nyssa sinensis TaxID=561372 RepID=A0A5J4ZR51_9ASTE|nr:hypothetical protein F0562_014755 [Nyssa sinensis]